MAELGLDQLAGVEAFAVDAARPVTGREKPHQVKLAGLQRLQARRAVLVDLDRDAVEIGGAPAHRQVACPVGRVAHVGDVLAELHRTDLVGPAADGKVHHDLVKALALPGLGIHRIAPGAAEHGQATHRQRHFAVGLLEAVAHRALVDHVQPGHVFQDGLVGGRSVRPHQGVKTVLHVGGQYRLAIVETRLSSQPESDRQAVARGVHVFGQQPVAGTRFVQCAREQRVEHQVGQVGRCTAPQGERVVFVEGGNAQVADQPQLAPFGRSRVHIGKMRKPWWVSEITPESVAMR
ncbi:hypothetical protein Y695_02463 [Hydrogenophaga sp. T4]|nr:hypothetical protein Y695_02463 [Hydrogenophaga sp. T4]